MVMTITREQVEQAIADANRSGLIEVCSTNSRNRHVELTFEYDSSEWSDGSTDTYHISNAGRCVAETTDVDAAVVLFNYYGSRDLTPN